MQKAFQTMFYPKNVPNVERLLRIGIGVALIVWALSGQLSTLVGAVAIGSALFIMATGFIGWCPACALVGRKIKKG